jgi:hypothetical protein
VVGFAGGVDVRSGGFDAGGMVVCSEDGTAVEDVAVPEAKFRDWVSVGGRVRGAAWWGV